MAGILAAEQRRDPFRRRLLAGDEAFGAEKAGFGVEGAGERVDGDDVRGFAVPGAVFAPVGGGDFGPGVGEVVGCCEDFHCEGGLFLCVGRKDVCCVGGLYG